MKAVYEANFRTYEVSYDECDDLLTVESRADSATRNYAESFIQTLLQKYLIKNTINLV